MYPVAGDAITRSALWLVGCLSYEIGNDPEYDERVRVI